MRFRRFCFQVFFKSSLDRNPCLTAGREPEYVASPRIELGSGASETLILSIVRRGLSPSPSGEGWGEVYFINPGALVANIFTAIASNITPKNFLTAIKPAGPSSRAIAPKDFKTRNTITRFTRIAIRKVVSP